jgi:hypothetical protein
MSPHCLAIFLQHSRSAGVIAAFGTAHAITGSAPNNTAKARTPTLRMSVNRFIVAATEIGHNRREKVSDYPGDPNWVAPA